MKFEKPFYIASYVKQFAIDESGTKHIDKSVYDEVQAAIESVLSRGFEIRNGKAVLKPSGCTNVQPAEPDSAPEPTAESPVRMMEADNLERATDLPRSGIFGSGDGPTVLVMVADATVMATFSDKPVTVIDIDRIGRMVGNPAYDPRIEKFVSALRRIAPRIRVLDCANYANRLEKMHKDIEGAAAR